jgi:hypothetical protein
MKLEVPYYSQFRDVKSEDWKEKSCTMACLKMAGEYLSPNTLPSIDQMMDEAMIHGASMKSHGLVVESYTEHGFAHDVIVSMAHNCGISAYKEEFKSYSLDENKKPISGSNQNIMLDNGLKKISAMLETGSLPIVSVMPGLSEGKSFHTILLVGFEENDGVLKGFYYHDPDAKDEEKKGIFISLEEFIKFWRKMAIFIG